MSPFKAGAITIIILAFAVFVAFTKFNPIARPYTFEATFKTANNLKPNSPVRIAGVEVGKVNKVQAIDGHSGAARVKMTLKKEALPIHQDASLKIRPRTFLEGNYFIDLQPGSPSSPDLKKNGVIPTSQTAAPVQFGDVLASLQSDTRKDLQTFLGEYSKSLEGDGAKGFNEALRNGGPAFNSTAQVNDAFLGQDPTRDLQRVLKGQARTFAALNSDPEALKGLVTNLNVTAGAFARQDVALEASVPALRDVLRTGSPALASLNNALPTLRVFSREALPGVRSSTPTLRASLPFITQARRLVGPDELRATARQLRIQVPALTGLNAALVPFLTQARTLSSCTANVLVPFSNTPVPNPDEPQNTNQLPLREANRSFVGLAGESRVFDGNNSYFRTTGAVPATKVRPAAPSDGGNQPPPRRPDVPCETQEKPNLNAPGGSVLEFPTLGAGATSAAVARTKGFNKTNLRKLGKDLEALKDSKAVKSAQAKQLREGKKAEKEFGK